MSADQHERDQRHAREDHRNEYAATLRLEALRRQEEHARDAARARTVTPLVQEPAHEFRTPIVDRFDGSIVRDHMLAPGSTDDTGFAPGCIV